MIIPPPPVQVTFEIEGLSQSIKTNIVAALQDVASDTVTIEVVAGGARGATKNALIAKAQANQNRDPFWVNESAMADIRELASAMFAVAKDSRDSLVRQIGTAMLASIQNNVDAQRNPDGGGFRNLTASYARRKQRQFGFVKPILRATGDLIAGLKTRVTKNQT